MTENERILYNELLKPAFVDLSNAKTVGTAKIKNAIVAHVKRTIIKLNDYEEYYTLPEYLIPDERKYIYEDAFSILIFGYHNLMLLKDQEYEYLHAKLCQAYESEAYKTDKRGTDND